ncbi:MAG: homogentisate phytyltransferase [Bacteroidota bacterium]|nr:homogentisate phytyltransferase [Bacteroidota bacterium]
MRPLGILWCFSRPHTIIGSFLSVLAIYVISVLLIGEGWGDPIIPLAAITGALACNIYITGLNQITDVAVDRINKPWLPLAAGELSRRNAITIVAVCGILALGISAWRSLYVMSVIGTIMLIGTAYSLPPLKFKRHHLGAAMAITVVRGLLVNLGLHAHFVEELTGTLDLYAPIIPLTIFVTGFSLGIAWFKDIPDTQGDAVYSFGTLAVLQGRQKALVLGASVVALSYLAVIGSAVIGTLPSPAFYIAGHAIILLVFIALVTRLDVNNDVQVQRFYKFFWALFSLEYVIYPIGIAMGS